VEGAVVTRIAAVRKRIAALKPAAGGERPRRTGRAKQGKSAAKRPAKRPAKGSAKRPAKSSGRRPAGWFAKRPARRPARDPDPARTPLTGVARGALMLVAFVGMVVFAVVLAKLTLVPSPASTALVHANFHPGASIRLYLDQPGFRDAVKEVGGNVVLGVPFGLLLPVVFPRARGLLRVVVVTALVMLCVETAQGTLVQGRAFDIDDVILNTFGALLGYVFVGRRLGRSVHPRRQHWWQRGRAAA
jgi:glycopeptide antibiotics resistance protein